MEKKILLITILGLYTNSAFTQNFNLVMNPSFEEVWFNPALDFSNDTLFSEYFHKCYTDPFGVSACDSFCVKYWHTKFDRNVYYYSSKNVCTTHYLLYRDGVEHDSVSYDREYGLYGVPNNSNGFIPSVSGNAYLSFVPIMWNGVMNPITGTLICPLKKDSTYKFSFFLRNSGQNSYFLLSKMEIIFSKQIDTFNNNYPYGFFWYQMVFKNMKNRIKPDLVFSISEKCDSLYWKKYEATYKARGGEQFFTIGVFFQNEKLIEQTENYMKNFRDEQWEKRFLKANSNSSLFINNNCYNADYSKIIYKNQVDLTKRAFYLIDEVSITPYKK